MRKIKLCVEEPLLPPSGNVVHIATSYQVATGKDFSVNENVICNNYRDEVNIRSYIAELDVDEKTTLYVRTKYHFQNGNLESQSSWSRIMPVLGKQDGIKLSNAIVTTPVISIDYADDILTITNDNDYKMYSGVGEHHASSYAIKDTDNEYVYNKPIDYDNLTEVSIVKPKIDGSKLFLVTSTHISDTNAVSNPGVQYLEHYDATFNYIKFTYYENLVIDRKWYYSLTINVTNFKSYDLQIRTSDDTVIKTWEDITDLYTYITCSSNDGFVTNTEYYIYIRLKLGDEYTNYTLVYNNAMITNTSIQYDESITYVNKFTIGESMNTNGINCFTTKETYDGRYVLPNFFGTSIDLYSYSSGKFSKLQSAIDLEDEIGVKYFNMLQLSTHDIIIDVVTYDENRQETTMFIVFEYSPADYSLTEIKRLVRSNERYTTSPMNSLVCTGDGCLYWIPSYEVDTDSLERIKLSMYKYDINTDELLQIDLPFEAKYNVGCFIDQNDNVYVYGGSYYNEYNQTDEDGNVIDVANDDDLDTTNEEYFTMHNRNIYLLNQEDYTFSTYAVFPDTVPDYFYALQAVTRVDGLIVFFNGCTAGDAIKAENQIIIVYNPYKNLWSITEMNGKVNCAFRSNIIFTSGNVNRVSNLTTDPQHVLIYHSNDIEDADDFESLEADSRELNVLDGETVAIEDIYKYSTINISGNGKILWYRPQGITTLTASTLIVNKSKTLSTQDLINEGYDSVLILEGVKCILNNGETTINLSSIEITQEPDKMEYYAGEQFDPTGMIIIGSYTNDGKSKEITDYTWSPETFITDGEQDVVITATASVSDDDDNDPITTSLTVNVIGLELQSIEIITQPDKTSYTHYSAFDPTGMKVIGHYNSGGIQELTEYTWSPETFEEVGDHQVTITVTADEKEFTATVDVNVYAKIESLSITTLPSTLEYYTGYDFDPTGMIITAKYSDGTSAEITDYDYEPKTFTSANENTVTISKDDVTTTLSVKVIANVVEKLEITNMPDTLIYENGSKLDTAGMIVQATYTDGTVKELEASEYTVSPETFTEDGIIEVTISVGDVYASFNVTVQTTIFLSSIEVTQYPTKMEYFEGDEFDSTGLEVSANYTDGSKVVLEADQYELDVNYETKEVIITYNNLSITFNITISAIEMTSIEVTTQPEKLEYYLNQEFDPTGMVVTGIYNNGNTEVIEDYTWEPIEFTDVYEDSVTIKYIDFTTTVNVSVTIRPISKMVITNEPTKMEYYAGEQFDPTGMVITVTYEDGESAEITDYTYTTDPLIDDGTITISKNNVNITLTVSVIKITDLQIITQPTKLSYYLDQEFDATGMVISATYENQEVLEVKNYTIEAEEFDTVGIKTVTIKYAELSASLTVTVTEDPDADKYCACNMTVHFYGRDEDNTTRAWGDFEMVGTITTSALTCDEVQTLYETDNAITDVNGVTCNYITHTIENIEYQDPVNNAISIIENNTDDVYIGVTKSIDKTDTSNAPSYPETTLTAGATLVIKCYVLRSDAIK